MDHVDEEWELIPSNSNSNSNCMPLFLPPNFYDIQPDYFTCPAATPPPPPVTLQHQQQQPKHEEGHHVDDVIDQQPKHEEAHHGDNTITYHDAIAAPPTPTPPQPQLFKDIPISTEFNFDFTTKDKDKDKDTTSLPAGFNWLEPDPLAFDHYKDMPTDKDQLLDDHCKAKADCPAGFNLWSLGLNGIGAICSFGVATAATLCILALGAVSASASDSAARLRPSPNIQFHIYSHSHDKRMKEVVQRATGVNHAISGSHSHSHGGITNIVRAQISFGGHYDHYEGL